MLRQCLTHALAHPAMTREKTRLLAWGFSILCMQHACGPCRVRTSEESNDTPWADTVIAPSKAPSPAVDATQAALWTWGLCVKRASVPTTTDRISPQ